MRGVKNLISIFALMVVSQGFANSPEAVPGEYVLKVKKEVSLLKNWNAFEKALDVKVKRVIPHTDLIVVTSNNKMMMEPKVVTSQLLKNKSVLLAEPNFIYRVNRVPNDPDLSKLWGLINTGQVDSSKREGVSGADIGAQTAWDLETGREDLLVAVIDTGIDYNHNDLKNNIWFNLAEFNGKPGVDDDNNGFVDDIHGYDFSNRDGDPFDDQGHGTHCAGTIGAKGNDGAGIVGVAWNVKLMGVKFLGADGSGSLDGAVEAIKYATQMGAKIMSNSWGGGGYSEILKEVIKKAGDQGIVFTAAAGNHSANNDNSPSYPASYNLPNVISVAAVDNRGELAGFSCYGRKTVHVAAPGVNVYSSTPNNGYASWSGTSMATPHVTGVAALLLSQEPHLTPVEVRTRLVKTSKPMASLKGKTASNGLVNAYLALINEQAPPDPNDPENWTNTQALNISTEHPYQNNIEQSWIVEVPGANEIALFFEKFKTEARYDYVILTNRAGTVFGEFSGDIGERWSSVINGNYVKITFKTDGNVNNFGFEITKAAFR